MSDHECCCIHYTLAGKAVSALSSIISVYVFVQFACEGNCTDKNDRRLLLLLLISLSAACAAGVLYYGVDKDKPNLLKLYCRMCVTISSLCLLTESLTREPQTCSLQVKGLVVTCLLLLLSASIVWRCLRIMSEVQSSTNSEQEAPLADAESSSSLQGDKIGDDPPSYMDVVYLMPSGPRPEKSSSTQSMSMPHESYVPSHYGSSETLPPAYHLAVSQKPYETNNTVHTGDLILRPSDIALPPQASAVNFTTIFSSSKLPQSVVRVYDM
ncbi:uncharacterized protein LOC108681182 [Hyalella azteca]|uniref:Uncharacterized protein LOC108681182 n=1 Tax=Hyalella azteca TaxID=294128 RepID=A0A8B7PJX6_HYAAZ|nr:uncharacterized protein LOC108681182 [Hyalella azteca]